jgi:hypothetical protein
VTALRRFTPRAAELDRLAPRKVPMQVPKEMTGALHIRYQRRPPAPAAGTKILR